MVSTSRRLGIIGGSGLYEIDGLEKARWQRVDTPWGAPSDDILTGEMEGVQLAFLPRHGRGHVHMPGTINYRANIDALKRVGCRDVISFSACGSFREHMKPGDFVCVDQFIDRTFARVTSFFGPGCVAHVSLAHPVCARLGKGLAKAAEACTVRLHRGGCYLAMEGPQFSTLAESRLYRENWGCDVVGMTNMPEARLAREAELCYGTVAMVTDFDSWHPDHGEVDVTAIIRTMQANTAKAREMIALFVRDYDAEHEVCPMGCDRALEFALLTAPDKRAPALLVKLDAVAGRVLKAQGNA